MSKTKYHRFTVKQIEFLRTESFGITRYELTKKFNKQFGTNLEVSKIRSACEKRGYRNGLDSRYKPNSEPQSKKLVGTMIIRSGYKVVKVADTGDINVDWRPLHHILWEFYHGELSSDESVVFLDQDKTNIQISNLRKVDMNTKMLFAPSSLRTDNAALNETLLGILEIDAKIKKEQKE